MTFLRTPLYVPLLAAYPVLHIWGSNWTAVEASDVVRPLALAVALALLGWGLTWLVLRDSARAALVTCIGLVAFASYGPAREALLSGVVWSVAPTGLLPPLARHGILVPVFCVLTVLVVLGVAQLGRTTSMRLTPYFNAAVAFLLASVVATALRSGHSKGMLGQDSGPKTAGLVLCPKDPAELPDIYVVILDGYGRADVLKENYEFDNSAFLGMLKERGFFVAEQATSNYGWTIYSLASMLNMKYFTGAGQTLGLKRLIEENTVAGSLKRLGYTIHWYPSGYYFTDRCSFADSYLGDHPILSPFETTFLMTTLARPALDFRMFVSRGRLEAFEASIVEVANGTGPKFIFAHLLSPHPPYLFDGDGKPVSRSVARQSVFWDQRLPDGRFAYIEQIRYLNTMMLKLSDQLLRHSTRKSIVILLGDHGPYLSTEGSAEKKLSAKWVSTRYPILLAVRFPQERPSFLRQEISPVNLFRMVFDVYFGTRLGQLPEKRFMTGDDKEPFIEIGCDPSLIRGRDSRQTEDARGQIDHGASQMLTN